MSILIIRKINYRFNIRGQLTSINNSTLTVDGALNTDPNALFGMQLQYDQADANLPAMQASFSGRISAVKWMTRNSGSATTYERSYYYTYDKLGRYTGANYAERPPGSSASTHFTSNPDGFDENNITYDENSNILSLKRNSSTAGTNSYTAIDNLTYTYDNTNTTVNYTLTGQIGSPYYDSDAQAWGANIDDYTIHVSVSVAKQGGMTHAQELAKYGQISWGYNLL